MSLCVDGSGRACSCQPEEGYICRSIIAKQQRIDALERQVIKLVKMHADETEHASRLEVCVKNLSATMRTMIYQANKIGSDPLKAYAERARKLLIRYGLEGETLRKTGNGANEQ